MKSTDSRSRARGEDLSSKISMMRTNMALTGSLNQVNALSKATKNKIFYDADTLLAAPKICPKIWHEMRKNDFNTEGPLTPPMMKKLYDLFSDQFRDLLYATSYEMLMEVLDIDKDGYINEDEQVLLFSLVKERMERVASDLLVLQEYLRYKQIMVGVREMESQINHYQDRLRKKLYRRELLHYQEIGEDKFDKFYAQYTKEFKKFDESVVNRVDNLNQQHEDQMSQLEKKLLRPESLLNIKPVRKLKELQTQEKLVSIEERVEEALDLRKELAKLEKSEEERVQRLRWEYQEKEIRKLQKEQNKELDQLRRKIEVEENNLIIKLKKDLEVLKKQVHLHENDIKRIHALATKTAWRKGEIEGEIKRTKNRVVKQNYIIEENKNLKRAENPFAEFSPEQSPTNQKQQGGRKTNRSATWSLTSTNFNVRGRDTVKELQGMMKTGNITKFYIRHKFGADRHANAKPSAYQTGDQHAKIEKYLVSDKERRRNELPGLAGLYNDNLELLSNRRDISATLEEKEKLECRKFIKQKLINAEKKSHNH